MSAPRITLHDSTRKHHYVQFCWANDSNTHDDDLKLDVHYGGKIDQPPTLLTKGQARELFNWLGVHLHT